jgi:hypothetical protein
MKKGTRNSYNSVMARINKIKTMKMLKCQNLHQIQIKGIAIKLKRN